jgi:hypothetical protein
MGGFEEMLDEFRALGGVAENIRQREGPLGRGLFAVDAEKPVAVRVPDALLLPIDQARFEGGRFRVAAEATLGARERAFLEAYENGFSWGGGGGAETRRLFEQANALREDLRARLTSEFHCGGWFDPPTDARVQEKFLAARCIDYRGRSVVMPIVELANHGEGPVIATQDGVGFRGVFAGEVLVRYAAFDAQGMFSTFGFAADQKQAFSIALGGRIGGRPLEIGRNLGAVATAQSFWVPRLAASGGTARLDFLTMGSRQHPKLCRATFHRLMRDAGFGGFEEGFDTLQHANRMHFLKLGAMLEDVEGPMARTLRRMARFQLEALSFCYGVEGL